MLAAKNDAGHRVNRLLPAVALALAAVIAVSGCAPVNAGKFEAQRFASHFEQIEGVESVRASGQNTLPFVAAVSANVEVSDSVTAEGMLDLMQRVADYDKRGSVSLTTIMLNGHLRVAMRNDPAMNRQAVETAFAMAKENGVDLVSVSPHGGGEVHANVDTSADPFDLFVHLIDGPWTLSGLEVVDVTGNFTIVAGPGEGLEQLREAIEVARALLDSELQVTELDVQVDRVDLAVASMEDLLSATQIAERVSLNVELNTEVDDSDLDAGLD